MIQLRTGYLVALAIWGLSFASRADDVRYWSSVTTQAIQLNENWKTASFAQVRSQELEFLQYGRFSQKFTRALSDQWILGVNPAIEFGRRSAGDSWESGYRVEIETVGKFKFSRGPTLSTRSRWEFRLKDGEGREVFHHIRQQIKATWQLEGLGPIESYTFGDEFFYELDQSQIVKFGKNPGSGSFGGTLGASMWLDVKERNTHPLTFEIFNIRDFDDPAYLPTLTPQVLESFCNDEIWGKQANVFVEVVSTQNEFLDYDDEPYPISGISHGIDYTDGQSTAEELFIRSEAWEKRNGEIQIFMANGLTSISGPEAPLAFWNIRPGGQHIIIVDCYRSELMLEEVVAHEMGHDLGLNSALREIDYPRRHSFSIDNIMAESPGFNSILGKHVRRFDWNAVNQ